MDEVSISSNFIMCGRHVYICEGDDWKTVLPDGTVVDGLVADPDYKEPKVKLDGHGAPDGVKRKLFHFKVMHCGWECDEDGWVVEMEDGSRGLVLMNHMSLYVADPAKLEEKLAEYDAVAADSRKALEMLRAEGAN